MPPMRPLKKISHMHSIDPDGMILSFRTDQDEQTVLSQIRMLLRNSVDQNVHYLPLPLHLLVALLYSETKLFKL